MRCFMAEFFNSKSQEPNTETNLIYLFCDDLKPFLQKCKFSPSGWKAGPVDIPRYDGWQNNYLSQDLLTWRGLKDGLNGKGTVDLFVGQVDLRDYLILKVLPQLGGWI